jgi:protocatechuate 3,4-dioxygenase beta subunit
MLALKGTAMRSAILVVLIVLFAAASQKLPAAEPAQYEFAVTVKVGDEKPIVVSAAYPRETLHRLPVTKGLKLEIQTPTPRDEYPATSVKLIDESSGQVTVLASARDGRAVTEERAITFVVCPGRVILQSPSPKEAARCLDLLPMAKVDPIIGGCGDCAGPYEGMPGRLGARARIAPANEPGDPLTVTGQVSGADGKPRAGVVIYAYQTDEHGIYRKPQPPRSMESDHHGPLRGWVETGAHGRYTFDTIRPANYPNTSEPAHIHMHVIERGCATYYIDELVFTNDPKLTPEVMERVSEGRGGKAITTPRRKTPDAPWQVVRDIQLGKGVPGYPGCPGS